MKEDASLKQIFANLMIKRVPSYANKFFYSLGFLSMICFVMLIATGVVMVAFGPNWWLVNPVGQYFRSIHLWSTEAFVFFVLLHLVIVFLTSGYKKPRRLTWVIGALMFLFLMAEAEFGYVLRGDYSSQYRGLQGADFFNGAGIGGFLNELNYRQIYGIHIVAVPALLIALLFVHYLLVKSRGIAKPYRKDVDYDMVDAKHKILFVRGGVLVVALLGLAVIFPSPFIIPTSIQSVAQQDPQLIGQTLIAEYTHNSDTATYIDNIDPYKYDVEAVYIEAPYYKLIATQGSKNQLVAFKTEPAPVQAAQLQVATDYYDGKTTQPVNNPLVKVIGSLTTMAQSGLYEDALNSANPSGDQTTYAVRFLGDTGVLDAKAQTLGITTDQYGMLKEEKHTFPLGAWWLAPIGILNHTVLANDQNGDRDGAIILGSLVLLLIAFPFIPGLNVIPDKLRVWRLIWRKPKRD